MVYKKGINQLEIKIQMSDNKKTLMLALAGGAAIFGAALIWFMIKSESEDHDEEDDTPQVPEEDQLKQQLEAKNLLVPKKDARNQLDTQYFLTLLQFVGENTRI